MRHPHFQHHDHHHHDHQSWHPHPDGDDRQRHHHPEGGPFNPTLGGPGGGPFRGRPGRPPRGGRREGALRAAVLALLDDGPRHGYRIITELAERSGGGWRPSPGSVYPLLQQLTDEGLLTSTEVDGRRTYELSEEGRRRVDLHREELSEKLGLGVGRGPQRELFSRFHALGRLIHEAAEHGTAPQQEAVLQLLERARRELHGVLATEDTSQPGSGQAEGADQPE